MFALGARDLERAEKLLDGYVSLGETVEELPSDKNERRFLRTTFLAAGLDDTARSQALLRAAICLLVGIVLSVLLRSYVPLSLSIVVVVLGWIKLRRRVSARSQGFEKDYTAMLLSLASAIRTGLDPLAAMLELSKLFAPTSEVYRELVALRTRIESGMPEEDAVRRFGGTIAHPDLPLFITAFILARREGSSLSECLQRLARVTRQRQSFRRKTRAAVAMQKLSAIGIGLSATAIGVIQVLSNPQGLALATAHPIGSKILLCGVALIVCGIVWMMRLATPKV
jgi:Flp pilus assembly protein TadB